MGDRVPSGVRVQTFGVFATTGVGLPLYCLDVRGLLLLERGDKLLALSGRQLRLEAQRRFGNLQHILLAAPPGWTRWPSSRV